jgi:hypothetical protein
MGLFRCHIIVVHIIKYYSFVIRGRMKHLPKILFIQMLMSNNTHFIFVSVLVQITQSKYLVLFILDCMIIYSSSKTINCSIRQNYLYKKMRLITCNWIVIYNNKQQLLVSNAINL